MSTNPTRWRRRRGMSPADWTAELDREERRPTTVEEAGPRLARGIVWSALVAEMERDWQAGEAGQDADQPRAA